MAHRGPQPTNSETPQVKPLADAPRTTFLIPTPGGGGLVFDSQEAAEAWREQNQPRGRATNADRIAALEREIAELAEPSPQVQQTIDQVKATLWLGDDAARDLVTRTPAAKARAEVDLEADKAPLRVTLADRGHLAALIPSAQASAAARDVQRQTKEQELAALKGSATDPDALPDISIAREYLRTKRRGRALNPAMPGLIESYWRQRPTYGSETASKVAHGNEVLAKSIRRCANSIKAYAKRRNPR
jgi:hypothetical protein